MKKLILIGNGFDLAHNYKTSYKDFADACTSPAMEIFRNMVRKYCKSELLDGMYWYDFELMINSITSEWFKSICQAILTEVKKKKSIRMTLYKSIPHLQN